MQQLLLEWVVVWGFYFQIAFGIKKGTDAVGDFGALNKGVFHLDLQLNQHNVGGSVVRDLRRRQLLAIGICFGQGEAQGFIQHLKPVTFTACCPLGW